MRRSVKLTVSSYKQYDFLAGISQAQKRISIRRLSDGEVRSIPYCETITARGAAAGNKKTPRTVIRGVKTAQTLFVAEDVV